jgi:acyl-CoA thioesterase FadM
MEQRVRRDGADLVRMTLKLACMTLTGRPSRIPGTLRADLTDYHNKGKRLK